MTAISADIDLKKKDGLLLAEPVQAGAKVYKGASVVIDASDGYAQPTGTPAITAGDIYAGWAAEQADNTNGADGDLDVRCIRAGLIEVNCAGTATQAKRGDKVYINNVTDDDGVTLTSDSGEPEITAGELVKFISATKALIDITGYVGNVAATAA